MVHSLTVPHSSIVFLSIVQSINMTSDSKDPIYLYKNLSNRCNQMEDQIGYVGQSASGGSGSGVGGQLGATRPVGRQLKVIRPAGRSS